MDEVGFLSINMRKALTKAYCMDYDVFVDVMCDGHRYGHTYDNWKLMQENFIRWYCDLDNQNASRFCYWVLYSED